MGLTIADLDELTEGMVMDMIIESANDTVADSYREVATQADFDKF